MQIDSDFTFQFGRGQIFVEWRQFALNIFNLMQTEIKDKTALSLLATLKLSNIPDGILEHINNFSLIYYNFNLKLLF